MGLFGSIWGGIKSVAGAAVQTVGRATGLISDQPQTIVVESGSARTSSGATETAQTQSALDALTARLETIAGQVGGAFGRGAGEPTGAAAGQAFAGTLTPWLIGGGVALAAILAVVIATRPKK